MSQSVVTLPPDPLSLRVRALDPPGGLMGSRGHLSVALPRLLLGRDASKGSFRLLRAQVHAEGFSHVRQTLLERRLVRLASGVRLGGLFGSLSARLNPGMLKQLWVDLVILGHISKRGFLTIWGLLGNPRRTPRRLKCRALRLNKDAAMWAWNGGLGCFPRCLEHRAFRLRKVATVMVHIVAPGSIRVRVLVNKWLDERVLHGSMASAGRPLARLVGHGS